MNDGLLPFMFGRQQCRTILSIISNLMKNKTILLLAIACLCQLFFVSAQAQKITITGKVMDELSDEPIPFANIVLNGTTRGTTTDFDGTYTLKTDRVADSLVVSVIGYPKTMKYISEENNQVVNFRLGRSEVLMETFVVEAGENPAHIILRKIIKNKKNNDIVKSFDNHYYESYNKLELDITNISEKTRNRKFFKPFQFIFENVDSTSEERPFLPMFLTETLSDYYHKKNPNNSKEVIRASKVSGFKDKSITQFLGNMYQNIDVYDNFIKIVNKSFASPIANGGLTYYKYSLRDSAFIDNRWCYFITFKPKRRQDNAFIGDFWVADTTFAIKRISMQLNAKNANINFIKKLSVFQEYAQTYDTVWVRTKDKLVIDFIAQEDKAGVVGRKTTTFRKHKFNSPEVINFFDKAAAGETLVNEDVFDKNADFWVEARHEELSANETKVYAMVDTLKDMPIVKTYIDIVRTVVSGYKRLGKIKIGPYFKLFSYNQVEGIRTRLGVRTSPLFSDRIEFGVYGAYGFRDKAFKYGADALFVVSSKPRQTLSIAYWDDLDLQAQNEEEFSQDNFLIGLVRNQKIPQKLIREEAVSTSYTRDWAPGLSTELRATYKDSDPYFPYYFHNNGATDAGMPPDSTFRTAELGLKLRFAHKEKFIEGKFRKVSLGSKYPIVNLFYTAGFKGVLGSDFNYHKLELNIFDRLPMGTWGTTEYILSAGKIFGTLPFPLLEVHPGNETFFFNKFSFSKMHHYEFISDTYATLFLTHHFDGFWFNRFPLLRKLKMRSLFFAKIMVGSLSQENQEANPRFVDGEGGEFEQFGGMFERNNWTAKSASLSKPYVEVGVGIENILRLIRVDVVWRLTYTEDEYVQVPGFNDNPAIPGVRAGIQLKF